jgi:hypothetical protein
MKGETQTLPHGPTSGAATRLVAVAESNALCGTR